MEIKDPNQMLTKKQLEVFWKTCLKKEVYDTLTDDLTGKIKHSLRFRGQIAFRHIIPTLVNHKAYEFLNDAEQMFLRRSTGLFIRYEKLKKKYGNVDTD